MINETTAKILAEQRVVTVVFPQGKRKSLKQWFDHISKGSNTCDIIDEINKYETRERIFN